MAIITKKTTVQTAKETEVWKDSSIYEEIMVSSLGRIKEKGYQRVCPEKGGSFRIYNIPEKILTPMESPGTGTLCVSFAPCNNPGTRISANVDTLVATEFVKNEDTRHYSKIKHKDGNKANVKASNLVWTGSGIFAK